MNISEWQRQNFGSLRGKFLSEKNHELFIISNHGIFPDFPVNPWLDFFEVLAFAWRVGFVAKEDLQNFRSNLEWEKLLVPHEIEISLKQRPLLIYALRLLGGGDVDTLAVSMPFVQFGLFADMHFDFRRNLGEVLFAVDHQARLMELLPPKKRKRIMRELAELKEVYFRWDREALVGLLFLINYLSHVTMMFRRWPPFVQEIGAIYAPWIKGLTRESIDFGIAVLGDIGESQSPSAEREADHRRTAFEIMVGREPLEKLSIPGRRFEIAGHGENFEPAGR